ILSLLYPPEGPRNPLGERSAGWRSHCGVKQPFKGGSKLKEAALGFAGHTISYNRRADVVSPCNEDKYTREVIVPIYRFSSGLAFGGLNYFFCSQGRFSNCIQSFTEIAQVLINILSCYFSIRE